MNTHKSNQRGDTIIEVLLCVSVVGVILAGAFAAANRSMVTTRQTQERTEAVQILQQQTETLKGAIIGRTPGFPPTNTRPFCFNSAQQRVDVYTGNPDATLPSREDDPMNNYNEECQRSTEPYNLSIVYDSDQQIYVFRARWWQLGGSQKQEVLIRYRTN